MAKRMAIFIPVEGANIKKGLNYVRTKDGVKVADATPREGRGRPPQGDLGDLIEKSIQIIQTIGAKKREMYIVGVAYSDAAFVAHKKGESARIRRACRGMQTSAAGRKVLESKRVSYLRRLDRWGLRYEWLVDAARLATLEERLLYLLRVQWTETKK